MEAVATPPVAIDWSFVWKLLAGMAGLLWGVLFLDVYFFKGRLRDSYSIIPRTSFGVTRILFSPLVHKDRQHLWANTLPLLALAGLMLFNHYELFWLLTGMIVVVDGLGTWLFGSKGKHLGASGVIYGYFGFALAQIYFNATPMTVLVAGFVGLYYRGLFGQLIPWNWRQGTSNVGHLFGFLGGIAAAYLFDRGGMG